MPHPDLRYCPRCAGALEPRAFPPSDVRHPVCSRCGFVLWQNPKPSVEAVIVRGQGADSEVLLGRRSAEPASGLWDAPGGFVSAGERIADVLARECLHEMGVEVRPTALVGAFEDEFLGDPIITLVFACDLVSGEPRPAGPIDRVGWFALHEPPPLAFPSIGEALGALRESRGL